MVDRIVVAGASLGGLRAAEQLRAAGWAGEIVVIGAEPHMPYNRPPLSKEVLAGAASFDSLAFRLRAAATDVSWMLGTAVAAADLTARNLTLADGRTLGFDGLVVATGLRPCRLPRPDPDHRRHVLRTVEDAARLRAALTPHAQLVVVGAGFIGCEVAATARRLGNDVTVVDPLPLPMVAALGAPLATTLLRHHQTHAVRFHLGRTVDRFEEDRVVLDDGTVLRADAVVEAIGSVPNTEWLAGNGLDLANGVLCDYHLRVEGLPYVVGVGDVARFPNARYDGIPRRVEHWSIPGDTAKRAARTLVAGLTERPLDETPFTPLPAFWSDQYGTRLQSFGMPALGIDDIRILDGEPHGDHIIVGYHRHGQLIGVAGFGGPATMTAVARQRTTLAAKPVAVG